MGEVIDMHKWRRARKERGPGAFQSASSPANDSERGELTESEAIVDEILFLADLRGVAVKRLLENRLAREQREGHGMQAIGALTEFGQLPADLDQQLRRWAAVRNLTLEELLQILLDELR